MELLNFIIADATRPQKRGNKVIVHICNDIGGWGRGFVVALSKRWSEPEKQYRQWYKSGVNFHLGAVQFVQVEPDTWVANIIGQHGIKKDSKSNPPIRYEAVEQGLDIAGQFALEHNATVHMPRIGSGYAGGTWEEIQPIIERQLCSKELDITVYDLPK